LKVVELTAYHVRIPLRRAIRHASHYRTETDNLVVRCVLEDQTEGFGEGVPRDYVTGETIAADMDLLRRSDLPAQFDACKDFLAAVKMCDRLRLAPIPGDDRGCQGNAARCAVELALLDAYGLRFDTPLSQVTLIQEPALFQSQSQVRYSGAITSARGRKLLLAALLMRIYRFHQVKVKVGIAGHDDVARLRWTRRCLRSKVDLRVDANEAWTPAQAAGRIRELEPYGISSVEQPVPHADVDCLAAIRRDVRVPIMLDESLCSFTDAERAVERRTCDLFNLRLSKCGGFLATLRLVNFARRHQIGYQLGCQVGETALLSAAGRHFATSVADIRYLEGSYDRHLVREPLGSADITFGWGGKAPSLRGPGLGVSIDPEALQRVTIRKEPILG
jgi:L-alanine-DL-glutamate epimerase-like enolase superfamily enzyme